MQNQVYSRYIYQMLMEYGCISVPSVGTFILAYDDAIIDRVSNTIAPPATSLKYITSVDESFFISDLLFESGMSKDAAQLIENLIVQDYAASKEKNIPFEYDGLGNISDHNFTEKEAEIFNRFYGLHAVKAIPVTSKSGQVVHNENYLYHLSKVSPSQKKSGFYYYLWPLLISAVVFTVILLWLFSNRSTVAVLRNDTIQKDKPISENPVSADITVADTFDTSYITDTVLFKEGEASEAEIENNAEKSIANKGESPDEIKNIGPSCVIIVGAFKNSTNANRMLKKIAKKGYNSYSGSYNGFKRVGITYDCSTIDPAIFKLKIRQEFNNQAWHLHDTI